MIVCSCCVHERALQANCSDDALRGFDAFVDVGDQRHADAAAPGIDAVRLAREKLPGNTVTLY